ncbi:2Fe-2S iron-sulfur cluster binding domain-containing protein [Candidatus Kuenenbacteria bacterium]|nr:2Fe-2S iron-sulfur cluster binding domain-containing protein [Candidatus Kuenenbacteria bacterium]
MSSNQITINSKSYPFTPGETILDVCQKNNIFIPTLCKHPDLDVQGRCRVCLVEIKNQGLVTACSTPAESGLIVKTNTDAVKRARRTNLELIYAAHIEKCGSCIQEHNCALKKFAEQYGLNLTSFQDRKGKSPLWRIGALDPGAIKAKQKKLAKNFPRAKELRFRQEQIALMDSGYLEFDASKCIDCGICTDVCKNKQTVDFYETVGKGFETETKPTDEEAKDCVNCGQCIVHCPVGAIQGVPHWQRVEELLKNKKKHGKLIIGQIAPSVRVSIGEEFGLPAGQVMTGQLAASLRQVGFDAAFDVTVGADFTTYEEARELIHWLSAGKPRPMITSCCPGWVRFAEFYFPEFISHLTSTRSPEIISGILAKTYWAKLKKVQPEDVIVVSIMPCTAKKQEISLERHRLSNGLPAVDYVLTTREYAYLLQRHKIDLKTVTPIAMNSPFGTSSGAAVIYGASGGVMESALRTAEYFLQLKKRDNHWQEKILGGEKQRGDYKTVSALNNKRLEFKAVRGLGGLKEATVKLAGVKLKVAVVNGLGNARKLLTAIQNKKVHYDYLEIMACPGGCIGGGGQPVPTNSAIRAKRAAALYTVDQKLPIHSAHANEGLLKTYGEFFQGDEKMIEELLHCHYQIGEKRGYKVAK